MGTGKMNDTEKVVKANIKFEVIGEEKPTKYSKRRKRWGAIAPLALLAFLASLLCAMAFGPNIYILAATVVSSAAFVIALFKAMESHPSEPGFYDTPWGYGL